MFYGGNVCSFCLCFFTAAHFHLHCRERFSFSHCCYIMFMFFFQRNWSLFLFIYCSSSFPVIQVNVDIKIEWKERLVFCCFLFSLKVRAAMRFTTELRGVLEMQNFTSAINILLPWPADSFPPLYGQHSVVRWHHNQIFLDGWIIKFS